MALNNLYFIAVIPRKDLREKINLFKKDFQARFNSSKALKVFPHITLKTPVKWPAEYHEKLVNWFESLPIIQKPFDVELKDFGAFHNKHNPVIFVKPLDHPALRSIQKLIINHFKTLIHGNVHPVDEKFNPHITIAYRDLTPENFQLAWEEYKLKRFFDTFEVNAIHLLQHDSRQWRLIASKNFSAAII